MAKVETTKTGSRNKVEYGTVGPAPAAVDESEFEDITF
jgi:hypothetical protein